MPSRETFANPPNRYRPIPFWFWNSKLRKEEIERQIRDFATKGIGGFFLHARFGLETPYLSREWMDCIRHAVRIADELGMEVWLYDENGFPSGIGDLQVSRVREYRSKFIELTERSVTGGAHVEAQLPPGEVVLAYAYAEGRPGGQRIDIMQHVSGNRLSWLAPKGEWQVTVYSKRVLEDPNDVVFGVDYLNPEAMRYFFDLALEPYAQALGEHLGKTIKGIFTDEPTLLPWHHDINWYGQRAHTRIVVWDDLIEREMQSREGIGAAEFLPHLFFDVNEATPGVRRAFWRTVADLYVRAFFEPYRQWCEAHDMKLTGHVLFEEGLYINTDFQADITELLSRMHIPGTDHLGEVTEIPYGGFSNTPKHLTNLQGEKLVTSLAHFAGKEAAISETYGCAGWGLSFERMKWIADWQYSLGINMLCPHAVFYSIEGFRKSDAPPSENHMAGWKHYRAFSDYIGRLSYMLREGRHVANVALLYPLREFWGQHKAGTEDVDDRVTSDSFDLCASILPRLHVDYDILSEVALSSARVRAGAIEIADERYRVLIAPPFALGEEAMEVVREFINSGGTWILPPTTAGEPARSQIDREIALVRSSMGEDAASRMAPLVEQEWPIRGRHAVVAGDRSSPSIIATLAGTSEPEGVASALEGALRTAGCDDVTIQASDGRLLPDVRYVHRAADGKHIYFITNTSERTAQADVSLADHGAVEIWNPETGETTRSAGAEFRDGRLHVPLDLAPYGSTFLVVDPDLPVQSRPAAARTRRELMVFPDEWQFSTEQPNALPLGEWAFAVRTHSAGEDYTYTTSFNCESVPDRLMLMLDDVEYRSSLMGGMDLTVEVNETAWHRPQFGWHLDPGFKTLDIAGAVRRGTNAVRLTIRHSAWSGQPHLLNSPAMLLGDFACSPDTKTILAPAEAAVTGSWTDFGYPFYSGAVVYTQGFRLTWSGEGRVIVALDAVSDMVEIVMNGRSAAVRLWQPWEADVTDLVKPGMNTLTLKVTNSMLNFLESQPRKSGLTGRVRLVSDST